MIGSKIKLPRFRVEAIRPAHLPRDRYCRKAHTAIGYAEQAAKRGWEARVFREWLDGDHMVSQQILMVPARESAEPWD